MTENVFDINVKGCDLQLELQDIRQLLVENRLIEADRRLGYMIDEINGDRPLLSTQEDIEQIEHDRKHFESFGQ